MAASARKETALAVTSVAKTFLGTRALRGVSLKLARGSIHALVGSNGSGKSTLVKILAGVLPGDPSGEIEIAGRRIAPDAMTPDLARACGLRFVHQSTPVFADLDVAENLALGHGFDRGRLGRIRWSSQYGHAREVLRRFHIELEPDTPGRLLGPSQQTMLAIARALQDQDHNRDAVLVLDEPTASLGGPDADLVLSTLRRYAAEGQAILLVTHRLSEVATVADVATVLRDGVVVERLDRSDLSEERLIEAIVGRPVLRAATELDHQPAQDVVFEARGIIGGPLAVATVAIRRGEIVGLAGLQGSGRSALLETLFGLHGEPGGETFLDGSRVRYSTPGQASRLGLALVPSDRARQALFPDMSVIENLTMGDLRRYWCGVHLDHAGERRGALALCDAFGIKNSDLEAPISSLSGGNQQKVVLARCLRRRPKVLMLDDPTQWIDVGARADIYRLLRTAVDEGTAVLLASSDPEELSLVCDRVLVLVRGRVASEVSGDELAPERLEQLAFGTDRAAA